MTQTNEHNKFQDIDIPKLLGILENSDAKLGTMLSCRHLGMTLQELAEQHVDRNDFINRATRAAIEWLVAPPLDEGWPPLLEKLQPKLVGRNGRPQMAYLLSEFGAHVLNLLEPNLNIQPPRLRDDWDLAHRYYILKTLERANYAQLPAWVEHNLVSSDQNVRPDVMLERGSFSIAIEIEQKLLQRNLSRAVRKFENWERYIRASRASGDTRAWRMYLAFHVKPRELPNVLRKWQEALTRAQENRGELPYEVYYRPACDLLDDFNLDPFLDGATLLEPVARRAASQPTGDQAWGENMSNDQWTEGADQDSTTLPDWISVETYANFKNAMSALQQAGSRKKLHTLLELAESIYLGSHDQTSLTKEYGEFPRESLWLMRQYLNDRWTRPLKARLKDAFFKIHKRSPGLILFRNAMTSMLWDVVLRHHGLGRGGALRVIFQVPDFQDLQSDFRVDVFVAGKVKDELGDTRSKEQAEALSWFLSSLYLYTEDLGLGAQDPGK
jgi:hypothetical protein